MISRLIFKPYWQYDHLGKVKGHVDQCQSEIHNIGRWAHINVKLHFSLLPKICLIKTP